MHDKQQNCIGGMIFCTNKVSKKICQRAKLDTFLDGSRAEAWKTCPDRNIACCDFCTHEYVEKPSRKSLDVRKATEETDIAWTPISAAISRGPVKNLHGLLRLALDISRFLSRSLFQTLFSC